MVEIDDYLWESVYIMKSVYDHSPDAAVLQFYRNDELDGDYVYEIAENSVDQFFADTRMYYNENEDLSVYVFFDPIITGFWQLCDEYEQRCGFKPEENRYRKEMGKALDSALHIPDYSYNAIWYTDTKHKNGCRLVLLCYCEFCGFQWIPEALKEAYDAFVHHAKRLKDALEELDLRKAAA